MSQPTNNKRRGASYNNTNSTNSTNTSSTNTSSTNNSTSYNISHSDTIDQLNRILSNNNSMSTGIEAILFKNTAVEREGIFTFNEKREGDNRDSIRDNIRDKVNLITNKNTNKISNKISNNSLSNNSLSKKIPITSLSKFLRQDQMRILERELILHKSTISKSSIRRICTVHKIPFQLGYEYISTRINSNKHKSLEYRNRKYIEYENMIQIHEDVMNTSNKHTK